MHSVNKDPLFQSLASRLKIISCGAFAALSLVGCGGGSGGDDDSKPTVRPKSLDGITLTLDSNVRFELVRNVGSTPAVEVGQIETGTFFYTRGGIQMRQYPNIRGDNSDTRYPDQISNASYSYRPVNDTSGVLTLNGVGANDLILTGGFNANNGSFTYLFNSDSAGIVNNQIEIDLTFASNGSFVNTETATVRIAGTTSPQFDTVRIPTAVLLTAGGAVPENYNPIIDPLEPSRIVPASLNDVLVRFNNGIPDPLFNFTIQFVSSATFTPSSDGSTPDEIGQGLLRVGTSVVDNAVNYTWRRIPGTENGTLVISGSNLTFDGTYLLSFAGTDNGSYTGQVDTLTVNANEVTGTFSLPGSTL